MKRIIKSVLSIAMVLSLAVAGSGICMAANIGSESSPNSASEATVTEVNGVRTAVTTDGTSEYTTVYNTAENTIQVFVKNVETGTVSTGSLEAIGESSSYRVQATRSTIHQDTFCDYEYDVYTGNPNEWNLERPKDSGSGQYYFKCYENSSNSSRLNTWFTAVNTLNDKEWAAIGLSGVAVLQAAASGFISGMAVVTGGILTPAVIGSVVGAVGATGAAAIAIQQVGTACNTCRYAIDAVYYATDNMHF